MSNVREGCSGANLNIWILGRHWRRTG